MPSIGRRTAAAAVAASLIALLCRTAATADATAAELAQALQRKLDGIKDLSSDFAHTYQSGLLRKPITERGHLLVKKPGKMRWAYAKPEEKLFVSDGVKMYSYLPQDKQVMVSSVPREDQATTPALFLAGKANLSRDFTPSLGELPAGAPGGAKALKLTPKSPQQDYDWLMLVVDPASLDIHGLVTVDAQGGTSSFSFTNLKENVGLTDKDFAFTIPRGVDVVSDAVPR